MQIYFFQEHSSIRRTSTMPIRKSGLPTSASSSAITSNHRPMEYHGHHGGHPDHHLGTVNTASWKLISTKSGGSRVFYLFRNYSKSHWKSRWISKDQFLSLIFEKFLPEFSWIPTPWIFTKSFMWKDIKDNNEKVIKNIVGTQILNAFLGGKILCS